MHLMSMQEMNLANKRVLIREDLNVPIKDGLITSDQRLQAALPTLNAALASGASVILLSHLGRPLEGHYDAKFSLRPVAEYLAEHLKYPVSFREDYLNGVDARPGQLVVCENVRFNVGEEANDPMLGKKLARLCDVFVMDAFGTAHRKHASTYGLALYAPVAVAGPLLLRELEALERVFRAPEAPIIAVVGGAKVSSKLSLLKQMVTRVNVLIPGGGIANTFLKATGKEIGVSLYEPDLIEEAKLILDLAKKSNCELLLPTDVVVGKTFQESCPAYNKTLAQIAVDDMIMDVGPDTVARYISLLETAKTIIWNGPLGVFEFPQFGYGTRAMAVAIAHSRAFSIAGGGDTLAAIDKYDLSEGLSYISTGGGAFLEYLEGKKLPAVAALEQRAAEQSCPI